MTITTLPTTITLDTAPTMVGPMRFQHLMRYFDDLHGSLDLTRCSFIIQQRQPNTVPMTLAVVEASDTVAHVARVYVADGAVHVAPDTVPVQIDTMAGNDWWLLDTATGTATATAAAPSPVIPRTAADAATVLSVVERFAPSATVIPALRTLVEWLPGGKMNDRGHQIAVDLNLCGEYEAAVCPTMGWLPRNGEGSSMARRCDYFTTELDNIEQRVETPAAAVVEAAARYARGGVVNTAIVDHADAHLESHKRTAVNSLLDELGMNLIPVEREWEVEFRVERTRTVSEYAYVTVTVTADDEDGASDYAADMVWDELHYAEWEVDDDELDTEVGDREVTSIQPADR